MLRRPPPSAAPAQDNVFRFDEAPEFGGDLIDDGHQGENVERQVREAQERLAKLRQEQEQIEQERRLLETLKQKQEEFIHGREHLAAQLEQHLHAIDLDLDNTRHYLEDLVAAQRDFRSHLEELRGFLPERWARNQLEQELDHALNCLQEAETSFEKGLRRLAASQPTGVANPSAAPAARRNADPASADDTRAWLRRGFAFTLPLIATILLGLLLAKVLF
jgi:vacuolar-type H+-ATPase subunit I/STV1